MNEIINITRTTINEEEVNAVNARELWQKLESKQRFADWIKDRLEGFTEGQDHVFHKITKNLPSGGRPEVDYIISIDVAKHIAMLERNEQGRKIRQYFIEVEKKWNTPEAVMARALQFANNQLDKIKEVNIQLETTIAVQTQQISELKPKASYYDVILNCKDLVSTTEIAKDYGKSAKWLNSLLHELGVQFKQGGIWLLYQKYAERGYTSTKTHNYLDENGGTHAKVHTYWTQKGRIFIYDLLKSNGVLPNVEAAG